MGFDKISKFSCPLSSKACINTFKWHLFQCKDVLQASKTIQINRNHWKSKWLVEKSSAILDWTRGRKDVPGAKLLTQAASASPRDMGVWKWVLQRFCHVYRQNEDILLLFGGRHFGPTHNLEFRFLIISNFLSLLASSACLWLLVWSHLSLSVFKMVVVLFKLAAIYESYPKFLELRWTTYKLVKTKKKVLSLRDETCSPPTDLWANAHRRLRRITWPSMSSQGGLESYWMRTCCFRNIFLMLFWTQSWMCKNFCVKKLLRVKASLCKDISV